MGCPYNIALNFYTFSWSRPAFHIQKKHIALLEKMRFNFKRIFFFKKHWVRYRAKRSSSTLFDLKSSESSKMSPNHTKPHHPPIIIIIIISITITITITILSLPDFNSILLTVVAITIIIILIELPPFSSMIFPAVNTSVFSGISQLAMFDYPGLITITIVSSPEYSTPHICFQLLYICGNSLLHHGVSGCSRIWERMGGKGFISHDLSPI